MAGIVDDKSQLCIPFIIERLQLHRLRYVNVENAPPFFLGFNGVQGAGKSVLVRSESMIKFHLSSNSSCPTIF